MLFSAVWGFFMPTFQPFHPFGLGIRQFYKAQAPAELATLSEEAFMGHHSTHSAYPSAGSIKIRCVFVNLAWQPNGLAALLEKMVSREGNSNEICS